jgi:hypothetical protein
MKPRPIQVLIFAAAALALMPAGHAIAQNAPRPASMSAPRTVVAPSTFAPIATPRLDPSMLKIPEGARESSAAKYKIDKPDKALPAPSLPNKVDLGKYDLEFKTGHSSDINPRTGLDSGENTNLSNSSLAHKQGSALPDYFGFKLSAPTK